MKKQKERYVVPFVIWANYDIAEEQDVEISANYLSGKVMQTGASPVALSAVFRGIPAGNSGYLRGRNPVYG